MLKKIWILRKHQGYQDGGFVTGIYTSFEEAKLAANIHFNQYCLNSPYTIIPMTEVTCLHWNQRYNNHEMWDSHAYIENHHGKIHLYNDSNYSIERIQFNNIFFNSTYRMLPHVIYPKPLLITICIAFQYLELPSLVLLTIFDAYSDLMQLIPMYKKWEIISLIRHSQEPGGVLNPANNPQNIDAIIAQ